MAYGNAPTPTGALKRIRGISLAVVILTGIAAAGSILAVVLSAGVTTDAQNYLNGDLSDEEFQSIVNPIVAAQSAVGVVTLATFVLTAIWMYRVASNIRTFQRRTTWSPLFGIFGWMLPPGFLYIIPLLMLRELWKASDPTNPADTETWRTSTKENPLLWTWFVAYGVLPIILLAFTVGSLLDSFTSNALESTAEGLDSFGPVNVIAPIGNVVAAAAWIMFVRQLTARHTQLTNER